MTATHFSSLHLQLVDPDPRGLAKSAAGCLMSGVVGVLARVRRDPRGDDESVQSAPSPVRSRRHAIIHHDRPVAPAPEGRPGGRGRPAGPAGVRHPLVSVLCLAVTGILAGCRSLTAIWEHVADLEPADPGPWPGGGAGPAVGVHDQAVVKPRVLWRLC